MTSLRTVLGAALTAVVLALAPGSAALAASPSPSPTQAHAVIEADAQLNVGTAAQPVHVGWQFYDGGANVPVPTQQTLVIDARDLAGVAAVSADDPRCTAAGQVVTCVDKDESQPPYVDFTVRADPGAALGATGTLKYTVSAEHGTGATAQAKVVVGVPELAVGKVPDVTHAKIGSRIELPLRLRNTGNLATDRRIMLRWEEVGGLAFDRKFSNCTYGDGDDPVEPGSQASVTCIFTAPVAAGATVELSSPLTATVGAHVLTAVTDYSAELLKPGVQPGGGSEPGTGPELTLVPASGSGDGFESGATGRFRVSADSSADLAATAAVTPRRTGGEWTLTLNAVNHGPASAYGVGNKAVALVDVVLPKGTVATGNAFEEGEDTPYGECFLWVGNGKTAPFAAGHRHYVCPVPRGVAAGHSQLFVLWVKAAKDYTGAEGTASVLPGPAGIPLHDPDSANDSATFTFTASSASPTPSQSASSPTSSASPTPGASGGTSVTPTATTVPGGTLPHTGSGPMALVSTAAAGAVALGSAALLVARRRRNSR
ncbi:LPXTG cell wall anchor domain-containing protein [Streptomyces sp. NBC_01239]|uniref:LPXTG cell wall anchor domain-containing protein n=1 Tax=Streptomyces sp. NBC_01239 TaxID=2903792 RepID=UPI00225BC96B|nr:LPXTG cell wall anchor domain-containing protein [Streptomyces sp. NBC_01239]MCX4809648.1 LPXTG cell wall anchor domain-containing protein [Streptomyces sp. NBC_01239]